MASLEIFGPNNLKGEIEVFGAKNAAMKMIAACVLINGEVTLNNVPNILDIKKEIEILEKMGGKFNRNGHLLKIDLRSLRKVDPDADLIRSMRASVVLIGPLLARFGKVSIPHPGGCLIGSRPIDRHLQAFKDLGVEVIESKDKYQLIFTKLTSDEVNFKKISVTGTENIIIFASFQENQITIKNAAIEPEIIDLINFLKKAGANIRINNRTIIVEGLKNLKAVEYNVMPDRIEAGTFAVLSALCGDIKIININTNHIKSLLNKFDEMGIKFEKGDDWLYIKRPSKILPTNIETSEYPGFPTDLQSPIGVLFTQASGKSILTENIFENRLGYLQELEKMGARIKIINNHQAEIYGPTTLHGANINSLDLRSGATLLIAALISEGKTEIQQAEIIDRGYEKIEERLQKIGAKIKRINN